LKGLKKPVILALNKIDLIQKGPAKTLVNEWKTAFPVHTTLAVSAKHGEGVDILLHSIRECLDYGPPFFPEDTLTDVPQRFIVAEMIREKVFRFTGEEIPYSIAVTVESFQEKPENGLVHIHAVIHVEKNSQKGIVIGKKGQLLKKIGYEARKDIERFLETKVYLELFVRVQKNWSKDAKALKKFGY
jgi:GTP-binding protein Era